MWGIPVELRYEPRRVIVAPGVHVEAMPWVSGKQRMTRDAGDRRLPWEQVARLSRLGEAPVDVAIAPG